MTPPVPGSVPLLLDTENLLRALGWVTEDERRELRRIRFTALTAARAAAWRAQREQDWRQLQRILVGATCPEDARTQAPAVLRSLVTWAEHVTGLPLAPRESYGKPDDSAVARLEITRAFAVNSIEHINVPDGADRADEELNARIDGLRRADPQIVMAIGSEDRDVCTNLLSHVDDSADDGRLQFVVAMPPDNQAGELHRRLFETWFWPGEAEPRFVSADTGRRRRAAIQHGYLNDIHHAYQHAAKVSGPLVPAVSLSAPEPEPAEPDWCEVATQAIGLVPRPSLSHGDSFNSPGWQRRTEARLGEVFGATAARRTIVRLQEMATWLGRNDAQQSTLDPDEWRDYVHISIVLPIRIPDWPLEPSELNRERVWRRKHDYRVGFEQYQRVDRREAEQRTPG